MDNIHEKIANLLALSRNNPSEQEAATALAMAQKLMMKWNIDERDLGRKSSVDYGDVHNLDRDYFRILGHAVKIMTGCGMVLRGTDQFLLVGTRVNVAIAEQFLWFLAEQVESLYKIHLPRGMSKSARAAYRKDFKRNCAYRIMERTKELKDQQAREAASDSRALVLVQSELEKEIEDFFARQGIVKVKKGMTIKQGTLGASHGRSAGDHAALQPRVK